MNRELELYLELQSALNDSRETFRVFVNEGVANRGGFGGNWTGAKCLDGWKEFVTYTALPKNGWTATIIRDIKTEIEAPLPAPLQAFLDYHNAFLTKYAEWRKGNDPNYDFTAGYNFPSHIDRFVELHIDRLHKPTGIQSLTSSDGSTFYKVGSVKQGDKYHEVWGYGSHFLTIEFQNEQEKPIMATGGKVKAFFAGLGIGSAIATLLHRNTEETPASVSATPAPAKFMSEERGGSYMHSGIAADPDASEVAVGQIIAEADQLAAAPDDTSVDADHLDDTPESSESATLIDSLQGIEESGVDADVVKVRTLGVARAAVVAVWGSKGVDGTSPTVFKRFLDLSTDHLVNIRDKSTKVTDDEKRVIESILENRVAAGKADNSVLLS